MLGSGSLVGLITALVTLIGGVAGLIFLFWPSLRPNEEPTAMGAQLSNPRVELGVTLGEYWDRRRDFILSKNAQSTEPTGETRDIDGIVVTVQVVIEGYADKRNLVQWTLIDSETGGRLVDYPALADVSGWPEKFVIPTANSDQNTIELWVEVPPVPGIYALVIDLYDSKDIRLASLQTDPFTLRPQPTPPSAPTVTPVSTATSTGAGSGLEGGGIPTLEPISDDSE